MHLILRKILGFLSRVVPCREGNCLRCGITHRFSKFHFTWVSEKKASYGVLCEFCFGNLLPSERFYYYQRLIESHRNHGKLYDDKTIKQIEQAVLAEK